jgi:putative addiction module component (TIGR02574 family)
MVNRPASGGHAVSANAEQLLPALLALPPADRQAIVHRLLESLGESPGVADDPDFIAMLNCRVEEIKTGKAKGIPADQVFRRLREKYP